MYFNQTMSQFVKKVTKKSKSGNEFELRQITISQGELQDLIKSMETQKHDRVTISFNPDNVKLYDRPSIGDKVEGSIARVSTWKTK